MIGQMAGVLAFPGEKGLLSALIFHRVVEKRDPVLHLDLDAAEFEQRLRWGKIWFNILPFDGAVARLGDRSLPPRATAVTFDDGCADHSAVALPILQQPGVAATSFIATGHPDGGRMWNDTIIQSVPHCGKARLDLGETRGRPAGAAPHRRNFRQLPGPTPGFSTGFMRLSWRLTSSSCVSHTFRQWVGLPILAATPVRAALIESIACWVARRGPKALRRPAARVPLPAAQQGATGGSMTRLGVVPSVVDAIRVDGPCPAFASRFRSCFSTMPMHFPKACLTTVLAHTRAPAWATIQACGSFGTHPQTLPAEHFIGKGLGPALYDREVHPSRLVEAGPRFIEQNVSHIDSLMHRNIEGFIQDSEVLVVGQRDQRRFSAFEELQRDGHTIFDLANFANRSELRGKLMELCG